MIRFSCCWCFLSWVINNRFGSTWRNALFAIAKNQLGIKTAGQDNQEEEEEHQLNRKEQEMISQNCYFVAHVIQLQGWEEDEKGTKPCMLIMITLGIDEEVRRCLFSSAIYLFIHPLSGGGGLLAVVCWEWQLYWVKCLNVLLLTDGWLAVGHASSSVSVNYQGPKLKLSNYCEYYYLRSKTEECHRVSKLGQTVCYHAIRHCPCSSSSSHKRRQKNEKEEDNFAVSAEVCCTACAETLQKCSSGVQGIRNRNW